MATDILARKLSISFHILPYGEARWWLTRESGRCPPCTRTLCSRCAKNEQLHDLRRPHLVIVADHPGEPVWTEPARRVAFAKLNADALSIAACRIAPAILGLNAKERLRALQRLFRAFAKGIFFDFYNMCLQHPVWHLPVVFNWRSGSFSMGKRLQSCLAIWGSPLVFWCERCSRQRRRQQSVAPVSLIEE
jgi:hypothetical protein